MSRKGCTHATSASVYFQTHDTKEGNVPLLREQRVQRERKDRLVVVGLQE